MLVVHPWLKVPLREFEFKFVRSSGPGGQNVNKVSTKVQLRWPVMKSASLPVAVRDRFVKRYGNKLTSRGDLLLTSQRFRDQGRNVADCLEKLRAMLALVAVAPKQRKKTKPSRAAVDKRLGQKRETSQKKQRRRRPAKEE